MLRALLTYFLHPVAMTCAGVALLVAVIWFGGGVLYGPLGRPAWLGPGARILYIAVVLLVALAVWLLRRWLALKKSKEIEGRLQAQAQRQLQQTRPDRQQQIAELEGQFDNALERLKGSKLGRGALYALPWYVIIGPPGSGKTKMLTESSLNFVSSAEDGRGIRGIGGTRNCDWWFADEGILLDTAGRYTTRSDDHEEWLSFLDMLKRARRRAPINGVVVCISLAEREHDGSLSGLLHMSEEELAGHADKIRARLDELMERLEMVFPVYVVFTKCDLLGGFVETFGSMNREERAQIWGITHEPSDSGGPQLHERFDEDHAELYQRLSMRRLDQLSLDRPRHKAQRVYSFPLQFSMARARLRQFLELLTRRHSMTESPRFRGFYFTSGTQEGEPFDRVLSEIGRAMDLETSEEAGQKKSYFIDDLLQKLVFRDRHLARSSMAAERRRRRLRQLTTLGAAAAGLLLGILLVVRYLGIRSDVDRVARIVAPAADRPLTAEEQKQRAIALRGLLDAGAEELDRGWPLGTEQLLENGVREAYAAFLRDNYLGPLRASLYASLDVDVLTPRLEEIEKTRENGLLPPRAVTELDRFSARAELLLHLYDEVHGKGDLLGRFLEEFQAASVLDIPEPEKARDFQAWLRHYANDGLPRTRVALDYAESDRARAKLALERVAEVRLDKAERERIASGSKFVLPDEQGRGVAVVPMHVEKGEGAEPAFDREAARDNLERLSRALYERKYSTYAEAWATSEKLMASWWDVAVEPMRLLLEDADTSVSAFVAQLKSLHDSGIEKIRNAGRRDLELRREKSAGGDKERPRYFDPAHPNIDERVAGAQRFRAELDEADAAIRAAVRSQASETAPGVVRECAGHLQFYLTSYVEFFRQATIAEAKQDLRGFYLQELGPALRTIQAGFPWDPKAAADACDEETFHALFAPETGKFAKVVAGMEGVRTLVAEPGKRTPLLELPAEVDADRRFVARLQQVFYAGGSQQPELRFYAAVNIDHDHGRTLRVAFDSEGYRVVSGNLPRQSGRERIWRLGRDDVGLRLDAGEKEMAVFPPAGAAPSEWGLLRLFWDAETEALALATDARLWSKVPVEYGPQRSYVRKVRLDEGESRITIYARGPQGTLRSTLTQIERIDVFDPAFFEHRFFTGTQDDRR